MVNAIKVAARFIDRLPTDGRSPETTDGRDGFVHPYALQAGVDRTAVRFILRDFDTAGLRDKEALLGGLAQEAVAEFPGASFEVQVEEQYRNMREVLDQHPEVVERAREAIRRVGLTARERPIRGGTDGSRLSFMGLPTPNRSSASRTSTRGWSGCRCRTWRRRWTWSSSLRRCGPAPDGWSCRLANPGPGRVVQRIELVDDVFDARTSWRF